MNGDGGMHNKGRRTVGAAAGESSRLVRTLDDAVLVVQRHVLDALLSDPANITNI